MAPFRPLAGARAAAAMLALLAALTGIPPAGAQPSGGQTFTVTVATDAADFDGSCQAPPDGDCTLREAVMAANANPGPDLIDIPLDGPIRLDCTDPQVCSDGGLQLAVTDPVTIQGRAPGTVIDAGGLPRSGTSSRVLLAILPAERPTGDLVLRDLELRGGFTLAEGGGLLYRDHAPDRGQLVLERVTVSDNTASAGGGLVITASRARLSQSLVTDNTATHPDVGIGGGLLVKGIEGRDAEVTLSGAVNGNHASVGGAGLAVTSGSVTISASAFRRNGSDGTPPLTGGAILAEESTVTVSRARLQDNAAQLAGGGLHARGSHVVIDRSTLDGNVVGVADADGNPAGHPADPAYGAAVAVEDSTALLRNSTLHDNRTEASDVARGGHLAVRTTTPSGMAGRAEGPAQAEVVQVTMSQGGAARGGMSVDVHHVDADGLGGRPAELGPGVRLFNTVLAGATRHCGGPDGQAAVESLGGNAEDGTDPCPALDVALGDLVGTDVGLGSFGFNGGEQPTRVPQPGSPLIDGGRSRSVDGRLACSAGDQDDAPRPTDGDGDGTFACDVGAVEVEGPLPPPPPPAPQPDPDPVEEPEEPGPPGEPAEEDVPTTVDRLGGAERIETAVLSSRAHVADGQAGGVVLTRADDFADAQVGIPLAARVGGPILPTPTGWLHPLTEAEIRRVLPPGGTVHLLGGTAALAPQVEQRLMDLGYRTIRHGGTNRFATAVQVAVQALGDPERLVAADGGAFAEAILAGTVAAADPDIPAAVVLVADGQIPPELAAHLADRPGSDPVAVGESAARAFPGADAVVGQDAPSLSVAVAERFFPAPQVVGVATDADFADALAGGAVVVSPAVDGPGPMLLSPPDRLAPVVADHLTAGRPTIRRALLFGGTAALSADVEAALTAALGR